MEPRISTPVPWVARCAVDSASACSTRDARNCRGFAFQVDGVACVCVCVCVSVCVRESVCVSVRVVRCSVESASACSTRDARNCRGFAFHVEGVELKL